MRLPQGAREIRGTNLSNTDYPHKDLTERIIACAIRVHRELGGGFVEDIYERAMLHELRKAGLRVDNQCVLPVFYDGVRVGEHRADLMVEGTVVVELKAVSTLTDQHAGQLMSTLKAARAKVGLLMNFAEARLVDGLRRIVM